MGRGALITLLLLGVAASPAHAATVDVTVAGNAYKEADIRVTQGDTVTWTFAGPDTNHSVTYTGSDQQGSFDSDPGNAFPNHQVGDKFSVDFSFAGVFPYQCKVHSNMIGRITVDPKGNNPNPPPQDLVAPRFGTPTVSVRKRQARFNLNEDAGISGKLRGPTRKTLKFDGKAGANVMKLPKRLKAGRYALVIRATDAAGNRSPATTVKFRVR